MITRRGVAQSGRAPHWGCGCRRFKSCRPDQREERLVSTEVIEKTRKDIEEKVWKPLHEASMAVDLDGENGSDGNAD